MAAFVECINLPQDLYAVPHAQQSVRFELTRPASGGVNIVARNLSFSYSYRKKPTLQDINLTIAAGETLAVVGLNGGGKTTLVKVLMGLYDYEGELLINGVSARSIDKQALYSRTSCLFQDYNMYPVTLRENVGVGRVEKMDDVAAILRAMEKGKADAVAKKLGSIETLLARNASRVGGAGDDDDGKEKNGDKSKAQGDKQDGEQDEKCPDKGTGCSDAREEPNGSEARDEGKATKDEGQAPKDQGAEPKQAMKKGEIPRDVKSTVLSGGQWQRVALARAFLRAEDADLVVFE
jgi:ABC-type multidrug transport system fused ATPase/permease subunit